MKKYGVDNFLFEIIEECDKEIIDQREQYWIKELDTLEPNGYNILLGGKKMFGENNPFFGKKHTEETKKKISDKNTGRKASEEERKMRSVINSGERNPFFGKHHTEEAKEKIKQSNIESGTYEKASKRMKENNPCKPELFRKPVVMLDKNGEILDTFESGTQAGEYIREQGLSKAKWPQNSIYDVCRGIQKFAYGYLWRYIKFLRSHKRFYTCGTGTNIISTPKGE